MSSNKVLFGADARNKLKAGIDVVHQAVASTLGASGRNGVFNSYARVPVITNDGVSLARQIEPEDLGERQGANLIKQVSETTDAVAGDGTTTSIVLAHAMITEGMALIDRDSANPMKIRREMLAGIDKVVGALKDSAIKYDDPAKLQEIANISVEDPEVAKTITDAIVEAGDDGIVYVSESVDIGVTSEKVEGYQVPSGLVTIGLVTDPEKMQTELVNPVIFITDLDVNLNEDFIRFVGEITKTNKSILMICDQYHPDVLAFAVANKVKGNFTLAIVKKPMLADYLEDIAALTGAFAMTREKGKVKYSLEYLGSAEKVTVKQFTTNIVNGAGLDASRFIEGSVTKSGTEYTENLKKQLENAKEEVTQVKLKERVARLTGNVWTISVGANTEAEIKYLRLKVDDAVNATKAAKEEGIVSGGGMALWRIADKLIKEGTSFTLGERVLYKACQAPLAKIVENSGAEYDDVVSALSTDTSGFNALTLQMETDMVGAGIIDPVKVTRSAFANAARFAALFLTIDTQIIPNEEKEARPQF